MFGQSKFNRFLKPSDTLNVQRRNAVIITEASVVTLGLIGLNELWYKDFPRSEFQTIDDSAEWRKVDKIGHVFSSYQLTRLGSESLGWSGANKRSQMIFGSAMSLGFLTTIEIFDGFSEEWGFSWSDFGANVLGSALFVGQDLAWSEQRMLVKFSFNRTDFPALNPDKLGENLVQEIFKDYNG
ncbi:MAG: DUF2279 domain-containing protein, partial [Flavobacteriaceae bacterium]|nr:DUF2279 domain-containing protein [Flavobacteriaceae bacterium]